MAPALPASNEGYPMQRRGRLLQYRIYIRLLRCCSLSAFFDTEDEFCLGERS
jgi:hypothetical protein